MAPRDVVYNANKFSLLYLSSLMYEYLLLGPCLLKVVGVVKFQELFDFLNLTVNDVFVLATTKLLRDRGVALRVCTLLLY
jgi:hypothetical protein